MSSCASIQPQPISPGATRITASPYCRPTLDTPSLRLEGSLLLNVGSRGLTVVSSALVQLTEPRSPWSPPRRTSLSLSPARV